MKPSRYNRIFQASDGTWLAFNSWSTALAEIGPEDKPFFDALLQDPEGTPCDSPEKRAIREAMVEAHFLVDQHEDEVTTLKADLLRDRFRKDELFLTIAPTMDCNFRCDYCYEDHLKVTMSQRVQAALLSWLEEQAAGLGHLHVAWYGGEPLLPRAFEVVEHLAANFQRLAQAHGFAYTSEIVTNAFFLDRTKMERLVELGVKKVQVTLDGPRETHNQRRVLISGRGTYDRIIANLKETVDLAEFQMRVNIDARNSMAALDCIQDLVDEGLADKMRCYLAQVTFEGAACGNIQEMCYSSADFSRMEVEVYREAAKRGLPLARYPFRIAGAFCIADREHGYVVAPTGALFKCWHEVTMSPENSVGNLLHEQQPYQKTNEDRWLNWDALSLSGCRECSVAPLCHGGCPVEAMAEPHGPDRGACEHYKYHLEPLLEIRHLHRTGEGAAPAARSVTCP